MKTLDKEIMEENYWSEQIVNVDKTNYFGKWRPQSDFYPREEQVNDKFQGFSVPKSN